MWKHFTDEKEVQRSCTPVVVVVFVCVCHTYTNVQKEEGNKSNNHRITHRSLVYEIMTVAQIIFALRTY